MRNKIKAIQKRIRAEYIEEHKICEDGIKLANIILNLVKMEEIRTNIVGEILFDNPYLDLKLAKLIEDKLFGGDIFVDEMYDHVKDGSELMTSDEAYEHVMDNPPDRY